MKENYNSYIESLNIDCECNKDKKPIKKFSDCGCGGINLPSHDNEIEVLIRQLKREVKQLLETTQAKLLCQDKKIAETMTYIKNNLSNAIRDLLDSMLESGEIEEILKSIILDNVATLQNQIDEIDEKCDALSENQVKLYNDLDTRVNSNKYNISQLTNKVNELEENQDNEIKDTFIAFGDSWTASSVSNSIWTNVLATNLGLNFKNYAVDGAGFVNNNYGLISDQVNIFNDDIQDKVINPNKVKYVIVMGGINDFRYNVAYMTLVNEIKSVFNNIKSLVPDAKLLYVANCQYPYQYNQFSYWKNVKANLIGVDTLILINKIPMKYFDSTYFHLNQDGQKLFLAQNIQNIFEGGEIISQSDERIVEGTDIKYTYVLTPINDNTAQVYIEIKCTNTTNTFVRYTKPSGFIDLPYSSGFYNCSGVALNKSIGVMYQDPSVLELDRSTATSTYYPMFKNIRV
jgi:hypothetical protein